MRAIIPDRLHGLPRVALVGAAPQQQIDVAGVAAARLASFNKGEQRTTTGHEQPGNPVGVIAARARNKDVRLGDNRRLGLRVTVRIIAALERSFGSGTNHSPTDPRYY